MFFCAIQRRLQSRNPQVELLAPDVRYEEGFSVTLEIQLIALYLVNLQQIDNLVFVDEHEIPAQLFQNGVEGGIHRVGVNGVGVMDDLDAGAAAGDLFERLRHDIRDMVAAHLQRARIDELRLGGILFLLALIQHHLVLPVLQPTFQFAVPLLQLLVFLQQAGVFLQQFPFGASFEKPVDADAGIVERSAYKHNDEAQTNNLEQAADNRFEHDISHIEYFLQK